VRERRPHERDGRKRLLQHNLRRQTQDAPPKPSESTIAPSIGRPTASMSGAIDLDDELHRRRSEVGDEAPDDHLPPKPNPELPAAQMRPKRLL
jgi:hypothetical protein